MKRASLVARLVLVPVAANAGAHAVSCGLRSSGEGNASSAIGLLCISVDG